MMKNHDGVGACAIAFLLSSLVCSACSDAISLGGELNATPTPGGGDASALESPGNETVGQSTCTNGMPSEGEPNDTTDNPNVVGVGTVCGTLVGADDVDVFAIDVADDSRITLNANADIPMSVRFRTVLGREISMTSDVVKMSGADGPGRYFFILSSPTHETTPYTLAFTLTPKL